MPSDAQVAILFLDADKGTEIARADSPAASLPERFEPRQSLELKGARWSVVSAEPPTRVEFARTGRLVLKLRRLQKVATEPDAGRYSLPTICDELPPLQPFGKNPLRLVELHEDDWRQLEFVTPAALASVKATLRQVKQVLKEEQVSPGVFRRLHPRTEVAAPLAGLTLAAADLAALLPGGTERFHGVRIGAPSLVAGGFAFALPGGTVLYGFESAGRIAALGLRRALGREGLDVDALALTALMGRHALALVDYCGVAFVEADQGQVRGLLEG